MIKIEFWLKKPDAGQEKLEFITIGTPKIGEITKAGRGNYFVCEVYLSTSKEKNYPIYGINPIDALYSALEFTKTYLQVLIGKGSVISELESHRVWKLEKLSDNYLQEKIEVIKNNKDMSEKDRQKILNILKESFSKTVIKEQLDKLI